MRGDKNLLDEAIALAATLILLLQLHELEVTEWLEDAGEIVLSDREMDVTDVEAMERDAVGLGGRALGVTSKAILLCFGVLRDDRDAEELLAS